MYKCLFCGSKYIAPEEARDRVSQLAKTEGRGAVKIKCNRCNKHSTLMAEFSNDSVTLLEWERCHEMAKQEIFKGIEV